MSEKTETKLHFEEGIWNDDGDRRWVAELPGYPSVLLVGRAHKDRIIIAIELPESNYHIGTKYEANDEMTAKVLMQNWWDRNQLEFAGCFKFSFPPLTDDRVHEMGRDFVRRVGGIHKATRILTEIAIAIGKN